MMYNLLFVDDDMLIIKSLLSLLDWQRLSLSPPLYAYSYEQALDVFTRTQIHIMVTDIDMLGHSGIELLDRVRKDWPQTMCGFLTCHESFEYARAAVLLGALRYLLKPVNVVELEEFLTHCVNRLNRTQRKSNAESERKETEWSNLVQSAVAYIQKNLSVSINRETISRELFVSYKTLSRAFNREVGMSITEYITRCRIKHAMELLTSSNLKITEISARVGYNYPSYFAKAFHEATGKTPQEFRSDS
jgi:YesN/AraC family two-component response regulator